MYLDLGYALVVTDYVGPGAQRFEIAGAQNNALNDQYDLSTYVGRSRLLPTVARLAPPEISAPREPFALGHRNHGLGLAGVTAFQPAGIHCRCNVVITTSRLHIGICARGGGQTACEQAVRASTYVPAVQLVITDAGRRRRRPTQADRVRGCHGNRRACGLGGVGLTRGGDHIRFNGLRSREESGQGDSSGSFCDSPAYGCVAGT